jgi:hypothetical protein
MRKSVAGSHQASNNNLLEPKIISNGALSKTRKSNVPALQVKTQKLTENIATLGSATTQIQTHGGSG